MQCDDCGAQLCPYDPKETYIWFSDEPVCTGRLDLKWVRTQRRLAKMGVAGFFTIPMLKSIERVRRGTCGANPDKPTAVAVREWKERRKLGA